MKRIFALLLAAVMLLSFAACSAVPGASANEPTEPAVVMENDDLKIDGIYVDTSFVSEEGPLKRVYVFVSLNPTQNMEMDSSYTKMVINGNAYESEFHKDACKFMPNYYYSSFIEDVFVGTQAKLALTFDVPEADLTGSKEVTFNDVGFGGLRMTTDEFVSCGSVEEIAQQADPEGYAVEAAKREPADAATVTAVSNAINGYYFSFQNSVGTMIMNYELEFYAPNEFELRTDLGANGGTYEVRQGYIFITYDSNGHTVEIEYEMEGGEISLYCSKAFSIYE